ncbi:DUF3099 domain-containing protein [Microbacterium sp. A93]|uniref:DUF3099 domain-containing protein n=1 Tax=Microbacterium sp. A93 TaxID=3450716 RepID=UPI003F441509
MRRYAFTMLIRVVCFALTVLVTPYGWYTWVFACAAAFLPYIAVVFANAVSPTAKTAPESPTQQLSAPSVDPDASAEPADPTIITIQEHPKDGEQ